MNKTNAMRQLDRAGIAYDVLEYEIGMDEFSGEAVAKLLDMDPEECYKTLALIHEHDVYVAVISVNDEIDLKKAARAFGVKNLELVHVKDLLRLAGYERGSVSPVGFKKNKGIIFDDEVLEHERIEISGGAFGIGLRVFADDLIKFLNARVEDIVR